MGRYAQNRLMPFECDTFASGEDRGVCHYVSDVLAGWLLGAAWAGAVILVGSWWADARRTRTTSSA